MLRIGVTSRFSRPVSAAGWKLGRRGSASVGASANGDKERSAEWDEFPSHTAQADVCHVQRGGRWHFYKGFTDQSQERPTYVRTLGTAVLTDPLINKGTAFLWSERERFHLRGLLPPRIVSMEHQTAQVMEEFREGVWDRAARDPNDEMVRAGLTPDNIRKWKFLCELQDFNESLFYRILIDNFKEMAPVVYTPTVGWACLNFSTLFRRARGMYFTAKDAGHMMSLVYNWPSHEVDAIVVTDGSRILGLGDLGMNGMGISIGKLDLYVAAAGFHPGKVLPCVIDVGTNSPKLRESSSYLGLQQPRLEGDEYLRIVDEFVAAVKARWPNVLIQFEDFRTEVAKPLLERYRHDHLCFNDDIQGTACTALAGVYGALAAQGFQPSAIRDLKFVVCGAGSAGMGVVQWLAKAMVKHGATEKEAQANFWVLDAKGLITKARGADLPSHMARFAREETQEDGRSVLEVVKAVKPSALLGLSGAGRIWKADTLQALADGVPPHLRPMVFPMSNPTSKSECSADDAALYTEGRAVFASGSPFPDASYAGKMVPSNQSNNLYIFPGLALGARLGRCKIVSDGMLMAASEALAACNRPQELAEGRIYPGLNNIRRTSVRVAAATIQAALEEGLLQNPSAKEAAEDGVEELKTYIRNCMYNPVYNPLVYVEPGVLE